MARIRFFLAWMLALVAVTAGAQEFVPVPPLQTRVTDKVGMLTENQRDTLEKVLKEYEERTGSQIAVLLISKTEPEAIEQYGIRVFDTWKLGRKGTDDGVLLIVAKDNPPSLRRLRIEAGRGVQGSLTDAQSKRILQDVIAPHFRQNDFYGGLAAGVSAITALLDKEQFPAPEGAQDRPTADDESDMFSLGLFFFFMVLFLMMSRMQSRRYARHRHGWGRAAPGIILGGGWGSGGFGAGGGGFGGGGGGFSGGGGGGFSGGGGSADGGGASGNW